MSNVTLRFRRRRTTGLVSDTDLSTATTVIAAVSKVLTKTLKIKENIQLPKQDKGVICI